MTDTAGRIASPIKSARRCVNTPGHGTEGVTSMQHDRTGREPNCVCNVCGVAFYTPPSQIRLRNGGQHCSKKCWYVTLAERRRGNGTPNFRGDEASEMSGRGRARRTYRDLGACERCSDAPAVDRHHKNGDTLDNRRENIALLCRRCHMAEDGRAAALAANRRATRKLTESQVRDLWARLQSIPSPTPYGAIAALAREFGVSDSTVRDIRSGKRYGSVTKGAA